LTSGSTYSCQLKTWSSGASWMICLGAIIAFCEITCSAPNVLEACVIPYSPSGRVRRAITAGETKMRTESLWPRKVVPVSQCEQSTKICVPEEK
jgi:hypothetical protein